MKIPFLTRNHVQLGTTLRSSMSMQDLMHGHPKGAVDDDDLWVAPYARVQTWS